MDCEEKFEDVVNHIRDLGDTDLQIYFQLIANNGTYMSRFTVDERIKLISGKIEAKFLRNLLTSNDFSILTAESSDDARRAQLAIVVRYVDSSTYETIEEYVCIRKLG